MPKFNVTFERVRHFALKVEAATADEADDLATKHMQHDGEGAYFISESGLVCTGVWDDIAPEPNRSDHA